MFSSCQVPLLVIEEVNLAVVRSHHVEVTLYSTGTISLTLFVKINASFRVKVIDGLNTVG